MDKRDVISFFDRCAPSWDAEMIRNDEVIEKILDGAKVEAGKTVLDVACGTGVLIPDYLERNVASVLGVDISPEMIRIAREKYSREKYSREKYACANCSSDKSLCEALGNEHEAVDVLGDGEGCKKKVSFVCADVETVELNQKFDCIMIYNAFPHFPEPENLIRTLAGYLKPEGTLTVAHGMSRAMIDRHHEGAAGKVSVGLMHEDRLAKIFERELDVVVKISNDSMYQVTGVKRGDTDKLR